MQGGGSNSTPINPDNHPPPPHNSQYCWVKLVACTDNHPPPDDHPPQYCWVKLLVASTDNQPPPHPPGKNPPPPPPDNPPPPPPPRHLLQYGWVKFVGFISWFWSYFKVDPDWLKELRGHLITTATVTATMAYQAILSPPGGFWQENKLAHFRTSLAYSPSPAPGNSDGEGQIAGHPILDNHREASPNYDFFLTLNTVVLGASLGTVLLALSGFPMKNKFFAWSLVFTLYTSIFFMAFAYHEAVSLESPKTYDQNAFVVLLAGFMCIVAIVLVLHSCHFLVWLCKKLVQCYQYCCKLKPKSRATNNSTGEENQTGRP